MELGLEGKVALVTGAGRNVGRAIGLRLAEEGATVVVNDFYAHRAERVAAEIRDAGGTAMPAQADVTDPEQVEAMVGRARAEIGPVDILVNNAGVPPRQDGDDRRTPRFLFHESPRESWERTITLNLYGTMNCTHAVLPAMVERRSGKIISVISEAGRLGEPRLAAYSAAKAGIFGFSKAVAREVGKYAVNVNVVALGAVDPNETPYEQLSDERRAFLDKILKNYPIGRGLGRLSRPDDVADGIAFLASDRARYVTGQCLAISGGFSMT